MEVIASTRKKTKKKRLKSRRNKNKIIDHIGRKQKIEKKLQT